VERACPHFGGAPVSGIPVRLRARFAGRRAVIDTIVNRARGFIYTTGAMPAQAAMIGAALDVIRDEPGRRRRLAELTKRVRGALGADEPPHPTPIIPVIVGGAGAALSLAAHLETAGVLAPAIRPPTVAPGTARVRISLRADLEDKDISLLLDALASWGT